MSGFGTQALASIIGAFVAATLAFLMLLAERRSNNRRDAIGLAIEWIAIARSIAHANPASTAYRDALQIRAVSIRITVQHESFIEPKLLNQITEIVCSNGVSSCA